MTSNLDLSDLLAPNTASEFLHRHWQQSALLIKRAEATRYQSLLPGDDINEVLSFAATLPHEAVELVGKSKPDDEPGEAGPGDLFNRGLTIRVRGIERYHEAIQTLCNDIELQLGYPTRANLYCTPGAARGFNLHFDTHEVFVLQLLGMKRWEAYEPGFELSSQTEAEARRLRRQDQLEATDLGPQVVDALLEPGDCLYLPRGFVHQAESLAGPSVHLTIGVHVLAAGTVADSSVDSEVTAAELAKLNQDTRVEVLGKLELYLSADGKMAALGLGEKYFWLPMSFAPVLRFVTEHNEFDISELPGNVGEQGKLVFARQLLQEGFLRVVAT